MNQEHLKPSSEQTQEAAAEAVKHKKRFCRVGLLAVLCLGVFFLYFLFDFLNIKIYPMLSLFYVILIITPFLAISSLVKIGLKGGKLKGAIIAILVLVISCLALYEATLYEVPRARDRGYSHVVCLTNLRGLGTALMVYADDYHDKLPTKDWCDRLVEEADVSPKHCLCMKSNSVEGESDYCLNQYAAGKKLSELPPDMVLLFEMEINHTDEEERLPIEQRPSFANLPVLRDMFSGEEKVYLNQWNQVGGPELLDVSRHHEGCHVLFADGNQKTVKLLEISKLRWDIEGKVRYDKPFPAAVLKGITIATHKKIILGIPGLLLSACAVYILNQFRFVVYWKFAIFLGLLSAAAGLLFGFMSGAAYFYHSQVGGAVGLVVGLLAGVCFAVIFAGRSNVLKQSVTFKWFMMGVGMITGILCSTFVHIALMIVNEETNPFGIIIGIPYGIFVGAVLGLISYFIIRKFYTQEQG